MLITKSLETPVW